ncbi:hypothetical protein E6P78_30540 [Streptomyces sp. A0958]|uniref:hypothetical protein n=1 Tax=Streptomyces sp. A0958 TaxID=2563101 RepID=UPI00109E6F74|nr:hypothetical protein [Streptomyces sp. A0958]THA58147.1 hypothetical protein E6P78_30540 [Streptomyces sp. A0958]
MEDAWDEAELRHLVGSKTHGVVRIRRPFGVFLELDGSPEVIEFLDIASYNSNPPVLDLPEVGARVSVEVAFHDEQKRQIRVRVGEPFRSDSRPDREKPLPP